MTNNRYLVWLEWPEACFRAQPEDIRCLKALVPRGSSVSCVHSEAAFLRALPRATHAIVWSFRHEWFAKAKNLKVLATPGAGRELVAHTEVPAGVTVHFGGYHGAIISETVAAFVLAWARGFFKVQARKGSIWPRAWLGSDCYRLVGTKAVVAGYGKIGKAIGAKLEALGVSVEGFGRANIQDLPRAAKTADWFIMALPSDTGTDDFLDARLLAKLPRRCVIVNIGRGNAIDEVALRGALETGRIAGAYLGVFKGEPTFLQSCEGSVPKRKRAVKGSPLWSGNCRNLIAMPHCSAFSPDYVRMSFKELKDEGLL